MIHQPKTRKKIAIVEDDLPIAAMYEFKLAQKGFDVQCAHNGKLGLELIERIRPDIILLDLIMPEMHGDEMLEKLRSTDWGGKIRVIILTNISRDEAPSKLRFLNVDRYVVKAHYTPQQVVDIVEKVLQ
jgi:DNA-binding response OmpR family regulator